MNFYFNSLSKDIKFDCKSTEYLFENEDYILLLDLNKSKEKTSNVALNVSKWLEFPTSIKAEELFKGGYFIVYHEKKSSITKIFRDASGIKTGYYFLKNDTLLISNQLHALAKTAGVNNFNDKAIAMLLALDFCFDGYTIYEEVNEFKMGSEISFKNSLIIDETSYNIQLSTKDNTLSFNENSLKLREEINRVHKNLAGSNNVVYLSGGIDSCVMLASLDDVVDKKDIQCVSYKVKGTNQDETVYAKSIAKHLNVHCDIKEINPARDLSLQLFEDTVLKMNNPYLGYWIFAPDGDLETTFFAGQDTRLHTPDVHALDGYVFDMFIKNKTLPAGKTIASLGSNIHQKLNLGSSNVKALKHLDRLSAIGVPKDYFLKYIFKFKDKLKETKLEANVSDLNSLFQLTNNITNKRHLYNEIVKIKWAEQYTDDIRYMQDLASLSSTYIAMPFYDKQLSEFSSSIPFDYASMFKYGKDAYSNTNVKVNKIILREAFKDKLNEEVLYRKKAVSVTNFLLFEGSVGKNISTIIKQDLSSNESFIKSYRIEKIVEKFCNHSKGWNIADQNYLMKIYYIGTLCLYFKNLRR